ncbi:uncharacterized protein LOC131332721 [Rhododendron vialii]|uniref:uncharacterized protein LOC131332721 n=1 Tax=Rhododendron vialii TaxID=182163 RepID=UPI00265E4DB5|nr:uncharacterized protein LOC131332721 [Rhododendron vialii]
MNLPGAQIQIWGTKLKIRSAVAFSIAVLWFCICPLLSACGRYISLVRPLAPIGPLYQHFGQRVVYYLGRSLNARVSSIIYEGGWNWPRLRNLVTQEIIYLSPLNLVPHVDEEDRVIWLPSKSGLYTFKSAWEVIRTARPIVAWAHVVRFPHDIPRWFSILWMACHSRLSTKDTLAAWGVISEDSCVLLFC